MLIKKRFIVAIYMIFPFIEKIKDVAKWDVFPSFVQEIIDDNLNFNLRWFFMKDDFIRLVKTQWIEVENNELKNYALVQAIMFAMIFLCISGVIVLFLRLDLLQ